jgi:4-hydroxybenzoate polyprenyltransferase
LSQAVYAQAREHRHVRLIEFGNDCDSAPAPDSAAKPADAIGPLLTAVDAVPLVVDLEGALLRSDLLIEAAFSELARRPRQAAGLVSAARRGRTGLERQFAETGCFDPAALPYDAAVLARIRAARAGGRPVYLVSAREPGFVAAVANHLRLFNGWFASTADLRLAGAAKAERLANAFGTNGFDYLGSDPADLPVWALARNALATRASSRTARKLAAIRPEVEHLDGDTPRWRAWAKLFRVHQYAKNALVFVPLLTAHVLDLASVGWLMLAAIAFSLCASAVYVLNDLVDLRDDRAHRTKCERPLAKGAIPLGHALMAVPLLLAGAFALAAAVSWPFTAVLAGYFALTTAYSFALKRLLLIDVFTLGALYTIRVAGGAVALDAGISVWLVGFCLSFFVSLALTKRYVELTAQSDANLPDSATRDYKQSDMGMVAALAAAAGFNAVTVLALYLASDSVHQLYSRPAMLWLLCPILTYWIARMLMLAQRRRMHDDPVVFALKDRVSLASTMLMAILVLAAA